MEVKDLYFNGFNVLDSKNNSYCIDMVRLKCKITNEFFLSKIENRISILGNDKEFWFSSKLDGFKNNYTISDASGNSFWLGFISNAECSNNQAGSLANPRRKFNLTLEFNPNKCGHFKFLKYLFSLKFDTYVNSPIVWEIISCDFAFDIQTNIMNLGGIHKGKKRQLKIFDNGGEDKTFYLGKGNNRVKIYNKKIESDLDQDLTRIELTYYFKDTKTRDVFNLKNLDLKAFPNLYLKTYQLDTNDMELDSTMKVVLYAVNNGYPIHDLSRRYRDRVYQYEKEKEPIVISSISFLNSLKNYLSYYSLD